MTNKNVPNTQIKTFNSYAYIQGALNHSAALAFKSTELLILKLVLLLRSRN